MIRKTVFWLHLIAGVISGVAIAVMCFTGSVLAFEKELVAWAERDARRVTVPSASARLTLEQLQAKLSAAQPEARTASIVVPHDPSHAIAFAFATGRTGTYYLNPYTGEVRQPQSTTMASFMRTMLTWHRYLGFTGETTRPRGKLINGIANVAFCVLAITGLYLWMPRTWAWRAVQPVIWFRPNATSKARDFNWHNTIGFWSAPILIALTLTAMPISFRWAGSFLYTVTGTPLPASGPQSSGAAAPVAEFPAPPAGATPLNADALLAAAQRELPRWQIVTIRPHAPGSKQPASLTVREHATWPRTALTTLQFDPFTGRLLRRDGYADLPPARQLRAWTRFLHTGEALGLFAQFLAGLACVGGCFLVYTGFALTVRRFFGSTVVNTPSEK